MKDIEQPLVTIVLTAYNHQEYIVEAINSVFAQSYSHIQLIVIDNASTDNTRSAIDAEKLILPNFVFIKNPSNNGICAAFNQGLELAEGKYIIDLSGDDVLLPTRIERQIEAFELLSEDYAVIFSNARYMNAKGEKLHFHYKIDSDEKALENIPTGDVYKDVLKKYFICTPTMMMRTEAVRQMGGYDESLKFEDFDFWVRSSVKFKYFYQDEVLTYKRNTPGSLGTQVYKKGSGILESCFAVCNKAYDLNRDQEEFDLLAARIRTFIRKCFYAQEFELAIKFKKLLNYIENPGWKTETIILLCQIRLPVNGIYRIYIQLQNFFARRKDLNVKIVT